jgi:hypothetical protein
VGFWSGALGVPLLLIGTVVVGAEAAEVFENFRVEDGRADFVDAHGPFAEIDFAAAVAAEWEVFVAGADDHCAGGAVEEFGGFFSGRHDLAVGVKPVVNEYVSAMEERAASGDRLLKWIRAVPP